MERAHADLEPLASDLFAERVDEAYWSHFSRNRFWIDVNNQHAKFMQAQRRRVILPDMPPIELYVNEAEESMREHLTHAPLGDNGQYYDIEV